MKTLPTTSRDERVRAALLDVLHAQWRELGVPFQAPAFDHPLEVIDPEALLWCSLHFFGSEPRLEEAVRSWFTTNRARVNTQRLNTLARRSEQEPAEATRVAAWRSINGLRRLVTREHVGLAASTPASLHLRSRDLLGIGCAAHLIVALLGSPRGVRCRDVAESTGYTYRCVADTAASWADAGLVRLERGFCTILDPTPWAQLLRCEVADVVTVDWQAAYGAVLEYLQTLERARATGVAEDSPLLAVAATKADGVLQGAVAGVAPERAPAIEALRGAIQAG
ncbi:MAG: hypothetical protein JNK53_05250 [Phycisphaerae bacterium]|nr:hypothetical protein [Phycisphaerae bacterium]